LIHFALILGSGSGGIADRLAGRESVPYADIPGFPVPAVAGHSGRMSFGSLAGMSVVAFEGRAHLYEGHSPASAGFIVRHAHALGARALIIDNAAGGITQDTGTVAVVDDHINMMFRNPLCGPVVKGDQRFPDMSSPYDPELSNALFRSLSGTGATARGVYAGVLGPSYETAAEIRMLAKMGADVVGMSLIPEVITARAIGVRVAAVAAVTNRATGLSDARLHHDHVVARASDCSERIAQAISALLSQEKQQQR
jgi:purine-nucleoside phosphorylase